MDCNQDIEEGLSDRHHLSIYIKLPPQKKQCHNVEESLIYHNLPIACFYMLLPTINREQSQLYIHTLYIHTLSKRSLSTLNSGLNKTDYHDSRYSKYIKLLQF